MTSRPTKTSRLPLVSEPLERRESPRVPSFLRVAFDGHAMTVDGELGLDGASFLTPLAPKRDEVEVAFAAGDATFVAQARVVGRQDFGPGTRVRLTFASAPTMREPSLAPWLATSRP